MITDFFKKGKKGNEKSSGSTVLNEKYLNLYRKISVCKYIVFSLLIVFLLFVLTVYSEQITAENFKYVIKELGISLPDTDNSLGAISYEGGKDSDFEIFSNDLAIASPNTLKIIEMDSDVLLNEETQYKDPVIDCCNKYLAVYEISGNSFSVYNSFSHLFTQTLDYPISSLYLSDSGYIAVLTRTEQYRSAVIVYNDNFDVAYRWYSNDKYVSDILLSSDGELLLFTYRTENGRFISEIISANIKKEETEQIYSSLGAILGAEYFSDGSFFICTDKETVFFERSGDIKNTYEFNFDSPLLFSSSENYFAVSVKSTADTNKETLAVFDNKNNVISLESVEIGAQKIRIFDNCIYIVYTDKIVKINIDTGEHLKYHINDHIYDIIFSDEDILLAVSEENTVVISKQEFKK